MLTYNIYILYISIYCIDIKIPAIFSMHMNISLHSILSKFIFTGSSNFKQNECFEIDHSEMNTDFDFEKNLALFDKLAVYEEMK